jgi:hypothetical protein
MLGCELALLYAYLEQTDPGGEWRNLATEHLDMAVRQVCAKLPPSLGLFGGLSGIGWAIEHVTGMLAEGTGTDGGDPLEDVDRLLLRRLNVSHWMEPYDLVAGLVGIGVYFLERLPRPSAAEGLEMILGHLEARSEVSWGGITWLTPPAHLPKEMRVSCPAGNYNLGVAHGVPGVIGFLGDVAAAGIEAARATRLLEGAVRWLLAQQRPPDARSRYGTVFVPGSELTDSRPTWCYGDPGIAATLYRSGALLERADWTRQALALLDHSLQRTIEDSRIVDAALCHGAFGTAHIYNRIGQAEGCPRYRDAATYWYGEGLKLRQPGFWFGGFFAWRRDASPQTVEDPSLLSGASGAALALIAAAYPVEPRWDRLLLLSGAAAA